MGLRGEAAVAGVAEWKPERRPAREPRFTIEQWALLAKEALDDAGIGAGRVNGIVTGGIRESAMFAPATVSEYLGIRVNFGEHLAFKTPAYAPDMVRTPIGPAATTAFDMAGVSRRISISCPYTSYTITLFLELEDASFCEKGKGLEFVNSHDLAFRGDFPCNTPGGQLSFGQAGMAGGMSHVCDATRQIMNRSVRTRYPTATSPS